MFQSIVAQQTCITLYSSKDSTKVKDVEVFLPNQNKTYYTNKKGSFCATINQHEEMIIVKNGFFTKNIIVNNNTSSIYLLPKQIRLKDITIKDTHDIHEVSPSYLRKVEHLFIYHGKKSERILVNNKQANLATNNAREIYRNVAGLNYIESSSSGLGTEIGVRGLSPERSSNLNIRQNGYDISADALGYPDAYYVPPSQAIDLIESVRGAGALQYGTQFGGMINYRKKKAPLNLNGIGANIDLTYGSYNFINSFNSVYGRNKKANFYAYIGYKQGDDWKPNAGFNAKNAYVQGEIQLSKNILLNAEYTHFYYLAQQPGGLTDAQFNNDPTTSIRDRNWFSVSWNLPSVSLFYKISSKAELQTKFFSLFANRKALGFLGNITRIDPLKNRDYLLDEYLNLGNETKWLKRYTLNKKLNIGLLGFRVYKGNTIKKQGDANDGSGPDFNYLNPTYLEGSDYRFPSLNLALFGENVIYITNKTSITIGARGEFINTQADGYYRVTNRDLAENIIFDTAYNETKNRNRSFILGSIGISHEFNDSIQFYGNFSQNYRAINFNDLRITNPNFRVDPNLTDEKGFNADLGIRGLIGNIISFDISLFYLQYANRIGFVLKTDSALFNLYRFRTNISQSRNIGMESTVTINWSNVFSSKQNTLNVKQFFNISLVDGKYVKSQEKAIQNKKVELLPSFIARSGIILNYKAFSLSFQGNYTSDQFTDATNATFASNAISGLIPAFLVFDGSLTVEHKRIRAALNINNISNNSYFTRRAIGYPGPGIIPAPPRMGYISLAYRL